MHATAAASPLLLRILIRSSLSSLDPCFPRPCGVPSRGGGDSFAAPRPLGHRQCRHDLLARLLALGVDALAELLTLGVDALALGVDAVVDVFTEQSHLASQASERGGDCDEDRDSQRR